MFRTALSLFSVFMLMVAGGCLPEFPKVGTVAGQTDTTPHLNDTTVTDTINHTDTYTTIGTDTVGTDTTTRDDTSPNPPLEEFRPCTTDKECINSEREGTYYCSSGGLCVSDPKPCTIDEECDDGNVCNGIEKCYYTSCYLGPRLICDDENALTWEDCNPETGCMYEPINECTRDSDCRTGFQCNFDSNRCYPRKPCTTAQECDDDNACTYDRCTHNECDNDPIACYDFNPTTLDICDPGVGCIFLPGCSTDRDCTDLDVRTRDECISGECVLTLEYVHVSVFSHKPEQQGDRIDYTMTGSMGQTIVQTDAIPSQLFLPVQTICGNGLYIDIYNPDQECDPYYQLTEIDVWRELTELSYTIMFDGCGQRIFVSPENFGCNTIFNSP